MREITAIVLRYIDSGLSLYLSDPQTNVYISSLNEKVKINSQRLSVDGYLYHYFVLIIDTYHLAVREKINLMFVSVDQYKIIKVIQIESHR